MICTQLPGVLNGFISVVGTLEDFIFCGGGGKGAAILIKKIT